MTTPFELFLLDQRGGPNVIALARRGADTAIEHLPLNELTGLLNFGRSLGESVKGNAQRPSIESLEQFGKDLFGFLFRDSLNELYRRLPPGAVSLQILSDRSEIKDVPWEYLVTPDRKPSPHRDRSIIRIPSTCGIDSPSPKKFGKQVRVLFVSADPIDQEGVTWEDVSSTIERSFGKYSANPSEPAKPALTK